MEIIGIHDSITNFKQHNIRPGGYMCIKLTEFKFFAQTHTLCLEYILLKLILCAWNTYFSPDFHFYLRLNFRYENEI